MGAYYYAKDRWFNFPLVALTENQYKVKLADHATLVCDCGPSWKNNQPTLKGPRNVSIVTNDNYQRLSNSNSRKNCQNLFFIKVDQSSSVRRITKWLKSIR